MGQTKSEIALPTLHEQHPASLTPRNDHCEIRDLTREALQIHELQVTASPDLTLNFQARHDSCPPTSSDPDFQIRRSARTAAERSLSQLDDTASAIPALL